MVSKNGKKSKVSKAVKAEIKKVVQKDIEPKVIIGAPTATSIAYYSTYLMNGCTQGTTGNQRVGSMIKMIRFDCRFSIASNAAGANRLRIILMKDMQPNGSVFVANDLFQDTSNTNTQLFSPFNHFQRNRYIILKDETYCLPMGGGTSNIPEKKYITWSVPLHNAMASYTATGSAGTIADIVRGAVYLVFVSDDAVNGPSVGFTPRLTYVDA